MKTELAAVIDLLEALVAFDTTSHKSNLGIQRFIADYLAAHGVDSTLIPSEDGEKAGLFATIGPRDLGGIGLSGHTDVVPVEGQTWLSDPFTLIERDGKLYGRGTADMKGYLACVLATVPMFARRRLKLPVHIIFSYDEETGCLGVRPMIAEMGRTLPKPRLVFVGEPTRMQVVDAHKGPVRWQVDVKGRAVHASMAHLGVNALTYAGRLMAEIDAIAADLKALPPNPRFTPPYPTLQVTMMSGGTATNIVPVSAGFVCEMRTMPGLDWEPIDRRMRDIAERVLVPEMRAVAPEAGITIERTNSVPPFAADPASEVVSLALKLAGQNETSAVSYGTEAGLFQNAGSPTVVIGPGDIAEAHTANEWIETSELEKCLVFLERLADWLDTAQP